MTDALIWRDAHDKDMFHLGVEWRLGGMLQHLHCATLTRDALDDLFGVDSEVIEARLNTEPLPIKLEMIFPPIAKPEEQQ